MSALLTYQARALVRSLKFQTPIKYAVVKVSCAGQRRDLGHVHTASLGNQGIINMDANHKPENHD